MTLNLQVHIGGDGDFLTEVRVCPNVRDTHDPTRRESGHGSFFGAHLLGDHLFRRRAAAQAEVVRRDRRAADIAQPTSDMTI
jgi:hypothetical protein